jgi:TolB-like protein
MKCVRGFLFLALLLGPVVLLPADIQRQVFQLLSSLSEQYREARGEPVFKETVALLPLAEQSAAIRKHELAAVVESLVVREMSRSAYFVLVERREMERLLREVELSLSDLTAGPPPAGLGELVPASLLLAGSIAEAGRELIISARLIETAGGTVLAAGSVSAPRDELIAEARTGAYSYVARHGLGFQVECGALFPLSGVPRLQEFDVYPVLADLAAGVSYRPSRSLQLRAGMHTAWTELQMGTFDPESGEYGNTTVLTDYAGAGGTAVPKYGCEVSQSYLLAEAALVFSPAHRLSLSVGGGGVFGLWKAMVKLNDLPVYIGSYDATGMPLDTGDTTKYVTKSVIVHSANSLLLGLAASVRAELFLSPRLLVFARARVQQLFASEPFFYTYGGSRVDSDDAAGFVELSGWQPNRTPWGDELGFDILSVGAAAGLSISF